MWAAGMDRPVRLAREALHGAFCLVLLRQTYPSSFLNGSRFGAAWASVEQDGKAHRNLTS